jgi:homoserine kinase
VLLPSESKAREWRIRVPASTSNLGSAFDAAGLALQLYLTIEVRRLENGPSRLLVSGTDRKLIPEDESNYVWRIMREVAGNHGAELPPFQLRMDNEIPVTKGLGSSAAACVAAAAAVECLCGVSLSRETILEYATRKEGHPDNAAPALYGGMVFSIPADRVLCSRIEFPRGWTVVAVTPDFELETAKARAVLPEQFTRTDVVQNVQRAAFLAAQIALGRSEGLREAMRDRLHQPYRASLLPGLSEILDLPNTAGLLGVALSGAGSTVVAFADAHEVEIGELIRGIFLRHNLRSDIRLLRADYTGLTVSEVVE